jgi:hypothetical protein
VKTKYIPFYRTNNYSVKLHLRDPKSFLTPIKELNLGRYSVKQHLSNTSSMLGPQRESKLGRYSVKQLLSNTRIILGPHRESKSEKNTFLLTQLTRYSVKLHLRDPKSFLTPLKTYK